MSTSTPVRLGSAGLKGWREKVADAVAEPASRRTPLDADQVRALIGAIFLILSIVYVAKASRDVAGVVRDR
jgi:hypothetical protein